MPVEINNLTENKVDEVWIKQIIADVLKEEKIKGDKDISLAFVGPGRMQKLNKSFRKKNRVTDVLSFPESKVKFGKFKIGPTVGFTGLGEIIICLREVKKNAKRLDLPYEQETAKIIIHGVLHLLGYDHEASEEEAGRMEQKEQSYLNKLFSNS